MDVDGGKGGDSELEIQARWYAGDYGREFVGTEGESVRVVQFGVWNRSAGPDFVEAAVAINGGQPRAGAIEIDPDARDWERHGHGNNAAFENVVLHVFCREGRDRFFTRTLSHRKVVQVRLPQEAGSVRAACVACREGRCAYGLSRAGLSRVEEILRIAAFERFRRKAVAFRRTAEIHGAREALFQAVAAGLGYAGNELPFRLLAQRLPLDRLSTESTEAEALMFGVCGFLSAGEFHELNPESRSYVRRLWEGWWRHRAGVEGLRIPANAWRFGGQRPVNHPQRRVAALAALIPHWRAVRRCAEGRSWPELRRVLCGVRHPFWERHFTLRSRAASGRIALLGAERSTDLLLNVFLPAVDDWQTVGGVALPERSARLRTAAARILAGRSDIARILQQGINQQGLLEMYEVYCRRDVSDCVNCPFPEQHPRWNAPHPVQNPSQLHEASCVDKDAETDLNTHGRCP